MRIALAQVNPTVGDLSGNRRLVEEAAAKAESERPDSSRFMVASTTSTVLPWPSSTGAVGARAAGASTPSGISSHAVSGMSSRRRPRSSRSSMKARPAMLDCPGDMLEMVRASVVHRRVQ